MKKELLGLGLSVLATGSSVYGFLLSNDTFLCIALLVGVVSYAMGGGISIAFKWAVRFGKMGWYIMPFPIDIITGVGTIIIAFYIFLFVPAVFVYSNYRKNN